MARRRSEKTFQLPSLKGVPLEVRRKVERVTKKALKALRRPGQAQGSGAGARKLRIKNWKIPELDWSIDRWLSGVAAVARGKKADRVGSSSKRRKKAVKETPRRRRSSKKGRR
jgi:hypothetical protein